MGTNFKTLYNFLMTVAIEDYKLNELFINNEEAFYNYLKTFLIMGTLEYQHDFIHSLEYEKIEEEIIVEGVPTIKQEYVFKEELLPLEQLILINAMKIYWYEKLTDDRLAIVSMIGTKSERDINDKNDIRKKMERIQQLRSENSSLVRELQQNAIIDMWHY